MLSPSEIADVIIDFSKSSTDEAILTNSAAYPYPSGSAVDNLNSKVMKFVIEKAKKPAINEPDSRIPERLLRYPLPNKNEIAQTRYITLQHHESADPFVPQWIIVSGTCYRDTEGGDERVMAYHQSYSGQPSSSYSSWLTFRPQSNRAGKLVGVQELHAEEE